MSDQTIAHFISVTGASEEQAKLYLDRFATADAALNQWFDSAGEELPLAEKEAIAEGNGTTPTLTLDDTDSSSESMPDNNAPPIEMFIGTQRTLEQNLESGCAPFRLWKIFALVEMCRVFECPAEITLEIGKILASLLHGICCTALSFLV
jgi:hypothetical protein